MNTAAFMATHPVFSLEEATVALAPPGGRPGAVQRLKHHLASGRLSLVSRGVYAVVPAGVTSAAFRPDPFLVAAAARRDAVFAYHSALALLGVAYSAWSLTIVYTARRRGRLALDSAEIAFYEDPLALRTEQARYLGTRKVERRGRMLEVTGPERTLVEGLRKPALAGGIEELLRSTGAFPTLDLALLREILFRYDTARLWAATGWILEQYQSSFSVPDVFLDDLELRRPTAALYLQRAQRGGRLATRWNLVIPEVVYHLSAADER
jgi:predicted transcriptional regulator of viral defense system